jgi:hypothetical protein
VSLPLTDHGSRQQTFPPPQERATSLNRDSWESSGRKSANLNGGRPHVAVGIFFDDERWVNSKSDLAVATAGSHNLRRRWTGECNYEM